MRSVYNLFVCILLVLPIVLSACGDSEEPKTVIEDDGMIWTSQEGYFVQGYVDVEQLAVEACSGYAKVGCLGLAVDCDRVDNPFDLPITRDLLSPTGRTSRYSTLFRR